MITAILNSKYIHVFANWLVAGGVVAGGDAVGGQASVEVGAAVAVLDLGLGLVIKADVVRVHTGVHTRGIWVGNILEGLLFIYAFS